MDKIEINSTSPFTATCPDVIIRLGEQTRLIFRPEIVKNSSDPSACVHGRFIYQKKARADKWENFERTPLTSIKKEEGFQLELKASELAVLMRELSGLYRLGRSGGVPQGKVEFLKVEQSLSTLLQLTQQDLQAFLSANTTDALKTLGAILKWFTNQTAALELVSGEEELRGLNALLGLASLRTIVKLWKENSGNAKEDFWQQFLSQHTYVLSQLLAYPLILIKDKAYVGGKSINNSGGNLVDFLCRLNSSGAAVLVEIKTPQTALLGAPYRNILPPSSELIGAISQVLQYKESLMQELHSLQHESPQLSGAEPYCVIIAGSASRELTDDVKRRSFERFRERVTGVRILTFDEVFSRIEDLVKLLENAEELPQRTA
jgi:hypothetical protein